MPRTDRASRVVDAPVARVFEALVDRDALETWLPPRGMTARFERFDPTPGGSYRLILTYTDPDPSRSGSVGARGKSSAVSDVEIGVDSDVDVEVDIVEARFVAIVPDDRVVQAVDFVADDPAFAGTMTMTWAVRAVVGGTRIDITAEDVPVGISAEDHRAGLTSSLDNLAAYVAS